MAYLIAEILVTFSDLQGHSPIGNLFKSNIWYKVVQQLTRFELT